MYGVIRLNVTLAHRGSNLYESAFEFVKCLNECTYMLSFAFKNPFGLEVAVRFCGFCGLLQKLIPKFNSKIFGNSILPWQFDV